MKTDELVAMLASGGGVVPSGGAGYRFALALGWGAFAATLLMALLLGVRPDLDEAARQPMFWVKLGFPAALAAAGLLGAMRLSRPGASLEGVSGTLAVPVLAMWVLAVVALARAAPQLWPELFFGRTWRYCPFLIAMLAAPVFAAVLWAMKGLAPTRLRLAGGAAGVLAGAAAAFVYALHCPEMEAPFLGVWYLLGMLIPALAGVLLGPRLLRW